MPTFDGEKCLNLAVKSLSALLRGMASNHNRDFYCLNCFYSYSTKHGLEKHERVCNDHDYCHVKMPKEDNKILEYDQVGKSFKVAAIIFAEFLLKKTDSCQNNPKNPYTKKKLSIRPLVTHCVHIVHLIKQKTHLIITEGKTVWKGFVKIKRSCSEKN